MDIDYRKYKSGFYGFDEFKHKIKLALFTSDHVKSKNVISHRICTNLYAAPIIETTEQIELYIKHPNDKRSIDEVFSEALINTFKDDVKYNGIGRKIETIEYEFYEMNGESYFLTSLLINPLFIKEYAGKKGMLFSVMSRNRFHFGPVSNFENIKVIVSLFGMYVFQEYTSIQKNKILPDIFYYNNDTYTNIVEYDKHGNFEIKLPDYFR